MDIYIVQDLKIFTCTICRNTVSLRYQNRNTHSSKRESVQKKDEETNEKCHIWMRGHRQQTVNSSEIQAMSVVTTPDVNMRPVYNNHKESEGQLLRPKYSNFHNTTRCIILSANTN